MKIYVLKKFPNVHKWKADEEVIGYFASRDALRKALRQHAAELSLYGGKDAFHALKRGQLDTVNNYLETGIVEIVDAVE